RRRCRSSSSTGIRSARCRDHLETLIVQCPDNFVVPPQAKRLANAVWLRDESLDRTQVGLPPRR
ncbi:MAG: hypothetical protein ABI867_19480, partial [Kofleriaceae bacterium]